MTASEIPKQTIRLGGRQSRKHRGKHKGKGLPIVGSAGHHSPLHEARSEDEDEDDDCEEVRGAVIQDHQQ